MGALPDDVKAKVMSLSKDALPIAERRRLYNQLGRRIKNPEGLAPGLVEQYLGYSGSDPKRFEMLKNFICDRNMRLGHLCVCFTIKNIFRTSWSPASGPIASWKGTSSSHRLREQLQLQTVARQAKHIADETFEELPLFEIEKRWGGTDSGKAFIKRITDSQRLNLTKRPYFSSSRGQTGKPHVQVPWKQQLESDPSNDCSTRTTTASRSTRSSESSPRQDR